MLGDAQLCKPRTRPRLAIMVAPDAMTENPNPSSPSARCVRQRSAAGADRRAVRAGKPRARFRHGRGAEGDRGAARHRLRVQDLVRQGEPHQRKSARGLGLDKALPIFADLRDSLGVPVLTDVHEPDQCAPSPRWSIFCRSRHSCAGRRTFWSPPPRPAAWSM